jgi:hypothetical protein
MRKRRAEEEERLGRGEMRKTGNEGEVSIY